MALWSLQPHMTGSRSLRYGFSVGCVAIALGLALVSRQYGFLSVELPLLSLAVALVTWYAGVGPSVLAVVLSTACFSYFFAEPIYSFQVSTRELPYFFIFIIWAGVAASFAAVRRRVESDLRQTRDDLKVEVEERSNLVNIIRALNEQLVKAQEAERMRIAGELHDGILQQITSLVLRLGTAKPKVPPGSEMQATVHRLQQELIQIGTDIRQLSHDLHPSLLQEAGLPAALSSYCEEFSDVRGIPVSCETDESVEQLSPGAALCLYRIAQEALGNAAKHASAKKIEVRLTRSDGSVCLSVSDDGVGSAPDQIAISGGLGVINMRERVFQLKGKFQFDSEPGRGTSVRVSVPFRAAS